MVWSHLIVSKEHNKQESHWLSCILIPSLSSFVNVFVTKQSLHWRVCFYSFYYIPICWKRKLYKSMNQRVNYLDNLGRSWDNEPYSLINTTELLISEKMKIFLSTNQMMTRPVCKLIVELVFELGGRVLACHE